MCVLGSQGSRSSLLLTASAELVEVFGRTAHTRHNPERRIGYTDARPIAPTMTQ
jgi:hypothetical protein